MRWSRHLFILTGLALAHGAWAQEGWMLLSREDGCVDPAILARREQLPRVPASPEDFAAMLRPHYPGLTIGPPEGFPPEMAGKVVMVRYADNRAPVFVRADICRALRK